MIGVVVGYDLGQAVGAWVFVPVLVQEVDSPVSEAVHLDALVDLLRSE